MLMKRPTNCRRKALTLAALVTSGCVLNAAAQEPPATSAQPQATQQEPTTPRSSSERYESTPGSTSEQTATHSQEAGEATAGEEADPIAVVELRIMDVDGDGVVSAREHESGSQQVFDKMDADHDGEVTAPEMQASSTSMSSATAPGTASPPAEARIAAVDRDADGKLTAEEHAAASRDMFGQLDGDRDGSLSRNEIQIGGDMMRSPQQSDSTQRSD
jgi:Ca2+-binding EF-hand superfamily protein